MKRSRDWFARRIMASALIVAALVATAAGALAAPSPKVARATIVATALAQNSVHYTQTYSVDLLGGISVSADVNGDSGKERETCYGGGRVETRLVAGTMYVKGNRAALEGQLLELTKAQARRYGGRWISFTRAGRRHRVYARVLYARLADGLTLASIVHDATPQGKLTLFRKRVQGLVVVRGRSNNWPAYSSLTADARGKRLPVRFSSGGTGNWVSGRFSKWNEPVAVQAPAHSTPIATVLGGVGHRF